MRYIRLYSNVESREDAVACVRRKNGRKHKGYYAIGDPCGTLFHSAEELKRLGFYGVYQVIP